MLIDNLAFQSNFGGTDSSQVNPAGPNGMNLFTAGFLGVPANGVAAGVFVNSFDIISTGDPGHTAMGMTVVSFLGGKTVRVDVYDTSNVLLGSIAEVPAPVNGTSFLGILTTGSDTIGRVNFFDPSNAAEGILDIAVYIPAPGTLALLGVAGLVGRRRRRA